MTRSEHVQWCKDRALKYLPTDPNQAFASMASDLQKHPETAGHIGVRLGMMQRMTGGLSDAASMRKFIDGFNYPHPAPTPGAGSARSSPGP